MRKVPKLPRPRVIQELRARLSAAELQTITSPKQLEEVDADETPRFHLVQTSASFRVPKEEWLPFLARSECFLACPGLDMPLAHNLVEAMSVGTIPLTEYPEFFDPPLQHGFNCFTYDGAEGLIHVMRAILAADSETLATMREHVIRYYETHLTPTSFVKTLRARLPGDLRLGMNFLPPA